MSKQTNPKPEWQVSHALHEFNQLTELATRIGSKHAADLHRCQDLMAESMVSLVFGGHFKSGKSTLLNTLIGRNLLPTNTLPETGIQCALSQGASERIEVIRQNRTEPISFSTEGIKQLSSLLTFDGQRRDDSLDVQKIEVSAPWLPMAPGVKWIDAPGYNDTKEMDERLLQAARGADVLVWVLHSQASISEVEVDFLRQFVAERGPDSLLFVVNVFLSQDSSAEWQNYLECFHPHVIQRVRDREQIIGFRPDSPAKILTIAARAQGKFPDQSFGGNLLRAALTEVSSTQHPLCVVSRTARGKLALESMRAACQEELKLLRQESENHQRSEAEKAEQRRETRADVVRKVNDAIRTFWSGWPEVEATVLENVEDLDFDSTYSTLESELNDLFTETLTDDIKKLQGKVKKLQSKYDYSSSNVDLIQKYISNIRLKANLPLKPKGYKAVSGTRAKVSGGGWETFLEDVENLGRTALNALFDTNLPVYQGSAQLELKREWLHESEIRIRDDLQKAQKKYEKGFARVLELIKQTWLPDYSPQIDKKLTTRIQQVEELLSVAQEVLSKLDVNP